jgi:hypothetical protein
MKTCAFCKSEIVSGIKSKRYCDWRCSGKARRTKVVIPMKQAVCEFCQAEFETKTARFCQDCRDASVWSYGRPALKRATEVGISWKEWRDKTYHW